MSRLVAVCALGTWVVLLAFTTPLGALDATFVGLDARAAGRAWGMAAASVGLAAGLLPAGALADRFGRRRVFVAGAALSAASSVAAGLAWEPVGFALARVVVGVGGAAVTASSLGILAHAFPKPAERTRATAVWGAALGGGILVGPPLSAALAVVSWRGGHLASAVIAGAVAALAAGLPESRSAEERPFDGVGAALLMVGWTALLGGLVAWRTAPAAALVPTAVGAVAMVVFAARSWRSPAPLLDLALFRRPDFVAATAAAFATGFGLIAMVANAPSVVARGMGAPAWTASIAVAAWAAASVVSATGARRLPERVGPPIRLVTSLVGVGAGLAATAGVSPGDSVLRLLPGFVVAGVAGGVLNATLARQAVSSVPPGQSAMGSGANNTARYVGAAFGMTLASLWLGDARGGELLGRWDAVVAAAAGASVVGALAVAAAQGFSPSTNATTSATSRTDNVPSKPSIEPHP